MITRKQYMDGECSHREYYAQFVNRSTRSEVERCIKIDRLLSSTDKHLNDIPITKWDACPLYHNPLPMDEQLTASTKVCILKEAARQLIEWHKVNKWAEDTTLID